MATNLGISELYSNPQDADTPYEFRDDDSGNDEKVGYTHSRYSISCDYEEKDDLNGEETSDEKVNNRQHNHNPVLPKLTRPCTIAISANVDPNVLRWDGIKIIDALRRNARTNSKQIVVYYYLASNLKEQEDYKNAIVQAIEDIEEAAPGIKFKKSREENNCIRIQYSSRGISSSSSVGMKRGEQILKLGWATKGNVLHELLHALGFLHQHQRYDRSEQVSIPKHRKDHPDYKKEGLQPEGRYDANSIMHYACGENMRDKQLWAEHNSMCLSNGDKIALNVLYPPVKKAREWEPKKGETGLYYCGKKNMKDNDAPFCSTGTDGFCGPDNGPNCHICRCYGGIQQRKNGHGHLAKQGETGLFYCGQQIKGTKQRAGHDDYCGPDNGWPCESCSQLLRGA
ncbi:unnamed protein product [Rotaria socialis]